MDSVDKSAFYIYVISRNKLARLGKGYSRQVTFLHIPCDSCNTYFGMTKYSTLDNDPSVKILDSSLRSTKCYCSSYCIFLT